MLGKGIRLAFAGLLVVLFPIVLFAGDRVEWTQSGSDFEKGTLIQLEVGHHSPPHLRLAGGMTTLWQETRSLGRNAVAVGVAVDSQDKILVTGYSRQDRDGFHTFKLDTSGQTLWKRDYTIGRGGQAAGIAVDPLRNVIVVGSATVSNPGFYTVKYDPNGIKLWERYYGTPAGEARGVAVDLSSNVIVTGVSVLRDPDFFTVKYDSSGNLLWAKREDIGRSDSARGVAADIQGNIYVVGSIFNADRQNSDFSVIKGVGA
ncbi:SBBP repeat-containing protein [Candidatus Acetothermia bacterium]|nr:SBBP repeat-containing protein [Candidatus Acetothermia bacterium]